MTVAELNKQTPMMQQWHACKLEAQGALLLFRLGDFYEAFHEDAQILAKELDITLTKRQDIPMSGVPFHAAEGYIDKLISKGYRVAIAEQTEDPKAVKGLVKREVVRIITPGTVIQSSLLSEKSNRFLASLTQVGQLFGLALLDLTTADFRVMELSTFEALCDEVARLRPAEMLISQKCHKLCAPRLQEIQSHFNCAIMVKEESFFDHERALSRLVKQFRVHNLDGFGLKGMLPAINAAGALLGYLQEELTLTTDHIKELQLHASSAYMSLSAVTARHLELTDSFSSQQKKHTLLHLLDHTATPMGGRLLRDWLIHPLLSVDEIGKRQEAIGQLLLRPQVMAQLSSKLQEVRDLERLIMRIETGFASPRDLSALRFSLQPLSPIAALLSCFSAPQLQLDLASWPEMARIVQTLEDALVESPPLRLSDGGFFKRGYHSELDALQEIVSGSADWMGRYQTTLREQTEIKTLKVGFTKAFGYYIEVSRAQVSKVPATFQRRQTLVNCERFITPELKELEYKTLSAEGRVAALEQELFHQLRGQIASHAEMIKGYARRIASIDALLSLALAAQTHRYTRPLVDESDKLIIEEGRHPIIEAALRHESFIPNSLSLGGQEEKVMLITGPNMAGKSTYIRQVALIAIMAHIGSYVPARRAHIGIIDKLFARIGASDDLARGQSTFMVEMTETAAILNCATPKSLVILDEIGRGTSTYDGISIAWAVAEYLATAQGRGIKTLFATHYWELTALEGKVAGIVNYNVAVQESGGEIIFMRKIQRGRADKSYGIHVARLAGLPYSVVKRAEGMLDSLERGSKT